MVTETISPSPILIYKNQSIDSVKLLQSVARIEQALKQIENPQSNPVIRLAFRTEHRYLSALLIYAAALYGRTILPLANHLSLDQQNELCRAANIDLLISDDHGDNSSCAVINSSVLLQAMEGVKEHTLDEKCLVLEIHRNFHLLITTSGTTAKPKLVLLTADNILAHVRAINHELNLNSGDCWLNCMPLSSVAGVMILFRCLLTGASHYLLDGFEAKQVWQVLQQHQISHVSLVPVMLSRLLELADEKTLADRLKLILLGGDRLSDHLFAKVRQLSWPVQISYGMSETTSTVALSHDNHHYRLLQGFNIEFTDQGLIRLKGPAVMSSQYINDATEVLHNGWFTTRDLGAFSSNGFVIHGRSENIFISGGQTLSMASAEQQLAACPYLKEFCLTTIKHDEWGDTLVAFVDGNLDAVEDWCREKLASQFRPRFFFAIDRLPVNEMGKLQAHEINRLVNQLAELKTNFSR